MGRDDPEIHGRREVTWTVELQDGRTGVVTVVISRIHFVARATGFALPSHREGGTARNKRSASPCSYFARFSGF